MYNRISPEWPCPPLLSSLDKDLELLGLGECVEDCVWGWSPCQHFLVASVTLRSSGSGMSD